MAVTVTQLAVNANCVDNFTGAVQVPSAWSLSTLVGPSGRGNSGGNWMVALVSWRQQPSLPVVTMSVADDAHNFWQPLGAPTGTSTAAGPVRSSIWYAPAAYPAEIVTVAPTGAYLTVGVIILEIDGLTPWLSLSALTTRQASSATTLGAMTLAAPASQMVAFTVSGGDSFGHPPALAGTGWTAPSTASANNGVNGTGDLVVSGAWQVTSSSVSATWSSTTAQDFSGVTAGLLVAGGTPPPAAQSAWPATITELALGAGANTPVDQLTWTPVTARTMAMDVTQGRQYQLAALETGTGSVTFDNPDGQLIPPGTGAFAGIDSGTPIRTRMIWQGPPWLVQFHGNGTTAQPQVATGRIFNVTPGVTYTAAAYIAMTLPDPGGLVFALQFFNTSGTLLTSVKYTTGSSGQEKAVVSGAAPAGAVTAAVACFFGGTPAAGNIGSMAAPPPGPAAAGYLNIPPAVSWAATAGATITLASPWVHDVRGAPQTSPHNVPFSGFCQKWPQQWDPETQRGSTTVALVDAWNYVNGNLDPILIEEVLNDQPYAYWPMTDAAGSIQASNRAPMNSNPLVIQATKYGNGGSNIAFGANSDALLGAQGTLLVTSSVRSQSQSGMWQQTLPTGVTTHPIFAQGYTASCTDGNYPSITANATVECWFQITAPFQAPAFESLIVLRQTNAVLFSVTVSSASPDLILTQGVIPMAPGSGGINVGDGGTDYRAMTGMQVFAMSFNENIWTTYINGVVTNHGTWAGSGLPGSFSVASFNSDTIQPQQSLTAGVLSGFFNAFTGFLAHVAIYGYSVDQGRLFSHYLAGVFASEVDGATPRIERLLQAGGYLGPRVMMPDFGGYENTLASCQDIAGQPASSNISNIIANTAPATLTVTPGGELFYLSRFFTYNQGPEWVLGDNPANMETTYEADGFYVDYDPTRTINDIQLTQLDRQDIVIPDIDETASVLQYGDNTYWNTGYQFFDLTSPATSGGSLVDLANWIASTNIKPFLRPATVTVDAAANPANWPFVLGAAAGDMVKVIRRPPTSGQVFTFIGRISKHQRTITAGPDGSVGSIQVTIDPAPEASMLQLGDPVRGVLDGTNRLAW